MTKLHGYELSDLENLDIFNTHPSDDLKKEFIERTKKHIALVNEYGAKIDRKYVEHDASKLTYLLDGYAYYCKPEQERTNQEEMLLDIATYVHITQAPHHPEYWTSTDLSGFTRKNPNPNGIIEVMDMPEEYLEELAADWCATSSEYNNTPFEWFNKVNGIRWLFTSKQQHFILNTLELMWT